MKSAYSEIERMRNRLIHCTGTGVPFYIRKKNDEVVITFVRGFADPDRNIILISQESHSRGMNFIEIKNIQEIQPWIQSAA
jgi:hypothetical protein